MKQHITVEQLNELSDKALTRLMTWYGQSHYPYMEKICDKNYCAVHAEMLSNERFLLSIGQMIEFLDTRFGTKFRFGQTSKYGEEYNWLTQIEDYPYHVALELCDALWEAVKEVLNSRTSSDN